MHPTRIALPMLVLLASATGAAFGQTMTQQQFDSEIRGAHDMKGRVTQVDYDTGIVHVNIGSDVLKLHFPPPQVQNLRKNDPLEFRLGIKEVKPRQRTGE